METGTLSTLAIIENIYMSLSVNAVAKIAKENIDKRSKIKACKEEWKKILEPMADKLKEDSLKAMSSNKKYFIIERIEVTGGVKMYPYGFAVHGQEEEVNYRIYFAQNIGDNYPIYVVLGAQYLHLNNVFSCIAAVQEDLEKIFKYYDKNFNLEEIDYKLSRLDICNHTNLIDLDNYINPNTFNKQVVTKISKVFSVTCLNGQEGQELSYYRYGSGDICIRFYNKVKEIVEQRYKAFFFKKWLDYKLIDDYTFKVYDLTYKNYTQDYRTAFYYSIICINYNLIDNTDMLIIDSFYKSNKSNASKYDLLKKYIDKYNLVVPKEIVNVEYQCRRAFLKSINLRTPIRTAAVDGDVAIDTGDIFALLQNVDILYRYLTTTVFRVIDSTSRAERKRDKKVDKTWKEIQKSKVLNIENMGLEKKQLEVYRKYNKEMSKLVTARDTIQKAAHLYYLEQNNIDIADVNIFSTLEQVLNVYSLNENYLNVKDKINKQIERYGAK